MTAASHGPRPPRSIFRRREDAPATGPTRRAAVIVNPTKVSLEDARTRLGIISQRLGWQEPLVLETTPEDPGQGQVAQALEQGVDLVCPLGGDGTVRAVATGLAHTGVPMGLLPGGTGNLLAHNLELPTESVEEAFEVACTGRNRSIDILRVHTDPPVGEDEAPLEDPGEQVCLVMAGVGFDAAVMASTPEDLKGAIGWPAYILSGFRHIVGHRFGVRVAVGGGLPQAHRVRSVIVGNCGMFQAGVEFMPDARLDDGQLDVAALAPRSMWEWTRIMTAVLTRSTERRLVRMTGSTCRLELDEPHHFQVDGDPHGRVTRVDVTVDPLALIVRVRP